MPMSDETPKIDADGLEAMFAAAKGAAPAPGPDLMARVQADALREMPVPQARVAPRPGLGAVLRALGGWPAVSGLAAATVAGIWIGASPPDALSDTLGTVLGLSAEASESYGLDPLGSFDLVLSEG